MHVLRRESDRSLIFLTTLFHKGGGEGAIYRVSEDDTLVAKIYHEPTVERAAKLEAMLANRPIDPARTPDHVSFSWPIDRLLDDQGVCKGFLMPYVAQSEPVSKLYNPKYRKKLARGFTWAFLLQVASNLASLVGVLHEYGYVVGDLSDSNFLVNETALVTLVDCDSIQVPNSSGPAFRCAVGRAEYMPAELHEIDLARVEQRTYHLTRLG